MSNDALIAQHGIQARHKRKYIATTNSNHGLPVAQNWLWTSDTTYVAKAEGRPYLAVITDLISRQVVGWSMQPHTKAGLVADALCMAWSRRHPDADVIMHSDRGSQYCSGLFQDTVEAYNMHSSTSRRGDCWDNTLTESLWSSLKVARVHGRHFGPRRAAMDEVVDILRNIRIFVLLIVVKHFILYVFLIYVKLDIDMPRVAVYTFGVLKSLRADPAQAGFHTLAPGIFDDADDSEGLIDHAGNSRPDLRGKPFIGQHFGVWGDYVCPRFYQGSSDPERATILATLSLWRDVGSVKNFLFRGFLREAFKQHYDWFVSGDWPGLVMWWVAEDENPTWAQAIAKLEQLSDVGPTPTAFSLRRPFTPPG